MKNGVYVLKSDYTFPSGFKFNKGQEIEIVENVVYVNGQLLAIEFQNSILNWMKNNPNLFVNDTRTW